MPLNQTASSSLLPVAFFPFTSSILSFAVKVSKRAFLRSFSIFYFSFLASSYFFVPGDFSVFGSWALSASAGCCGAVWMFSLQWINGAAYHRAGDLPLSAWGRRVLLPHLQVRSLSWRSFGRSLLQQGVFSFKLLGTLAGRVYPQPANQSWD